MTTTETTTQTPGLCPSWCHEHYYADDGSGFVHMTARSVFLQPHGGGAVVAGAEADDGRAAVIFLEGAEDARLIPEQAAALGAELIRLAHDA